jgi:hypothetical protein
MTYIKCVSDGLEGVGIFWLKPASHTTLESRPDYPVEDGNLIMAHLIQITGLSYIGCFHHTSRRTAVV